MKQLKELYQRLNTEKTFSSKYPQFSRTDRKIHVLYLSACLNETGYYRMILPALELNRTQTHQAIVAHIHKWDFNKQFDDYDNPIDLRLIEWADYVVLPALFTPVDYIVKTMREVNDDVEFVMDFDQNYHELPDYHPDFEKLKPELKEALLANLSQIDILTASNGLILSYYHNLVKKLDQDYLLHFERFPNLLSNFTFSGISEIKRNENAKIRIGLLLDPSQAADLQTIEKPIAALLEAHKQNIEFVIYGSSKRILDSCKLLQALRITFVKPVSFDNYPERLNDLAFDIGLLPLVNNSYSVSGKSLNRFLDFSANMVPVVAASVMPYQKIISDGDTGYIASSEQEWIDKTNQLIADPQLRKDMGNNGFKLAWEDHSYTPKTIQRLKSIFV